MLWQTGSFHQKRLQPVLQNWERNVGTSQMPKNIQDHLGELLGFMDDYVI
jgi:hypothetical protein